jgi:hypothetical protein
LLFSDLVLILLSWATVAEIVIGDSATDESLNSGKSKLKFKIVLKNAKFWGFLEF